MILSIRQLIYQERRRLAFVSSLAFIAGYLFYLRPSLEVGAPLIALSTGSIYAIVIALFTLLICAFAPGFRFMLDAIAVSRLCLALVCFLIPEVGLIIIHNPLLTALIVVSGAGVISRSLHGQILRDPDMTWRDKYGLRAGLVRKPVRVRGTERQQRFTGWVEDSRLVGG